MNDEERAAKREEIAQAIATAQGCTIEQARARGMILGRSLAGTLTDEHERLELMRAAGWLDA